MGIPIILVNLAANPGFSKRPFAYFNRLKSSVDKTIGIFSIHSIAFSMLSSPSRGFLSQAGSSALSSVSAGRPAAGILDGPLVIAYRLVHAPGLLMEQGEHSVAFPPAGTIERRGLQVGHDCLIDLAEFILS